MEVIDGLREDFGDASFLEQNRCENAGADIRANGNDGGIEVLHAEFRKRVLIHGIRLNRLRHIRRDGLDQFLVPIHREHLMSQFAQAPRHARPEAPQAQHHKRLLLFLHNNSFLKEAPEALPLDSGRALPCTCQRVFDPLDSLFAIELSATAYNVRVLIEGTACRTVYAPDGSFLHDTSLIRVPPASTSADFPRPRCASGLPPLHSASFPELIEP